DRLHRSIHHYERESTMTKAQIIERVSEQITTLTKRQAEVVVNTIFDCVRDSLKNGDKTEIRGFGSFRLRARRMKEGRNPKTGATVAVPAKKVPFFKAGKELKELLNQTYRDHHHEFTRPPRCR